MKNKILYLAFCAAGLLTTTSCEDYLETSSKSNADANFVFSNMTTARAAMDGAYAEWHGAISSHIFGDGLFYAFFKLQRGLPSKFVFKFARIYCIT